MSTSSYHGQPVLKEPVWTWEIPTYFYTGGLAGASAGLAYLAETSGNPILARRAWGAAAAGVAVSPVLLTSDLGKPARFLNMFRMFKVTSPMSVGSWLLAASGATTSVAALNAWTGLLPRMARVARPSAAVLGLPLCTYTGALIANTAVPVWHQARRELPFVFAAGAALSAGGAGLALTPPRAAGPARRLALAGAVLESAANEWMRHRLGEHAEPYKRGEAAVLTNVARAAIALGAALAATRAGRSRAGAAAAGGLLSAGALAVRLTIFKAGFQSATDPKYVIGPQREGIRSGRRNGAARGTSRVGQPDRSIGSPATFVS